MLGQEDTTPNGPNETRIKGKFLCGGENKKNDLTEEIIKHNAPEIPANYEKQHKDDQDNQMRDDDFMSEDEVDSEELDEESIINNVEVEIIEDENYSAGEKLISACRVFPPPLQHFLEGNSQDDLAIPCYSGGQRKRKKSDPREWRDSKNRRLRELGENYVGWSRPSSKDGNKVVAKRGVERKGRQIGPRCISSRCRNSSTMQCNLVPESVREGIFHSFWHGMTWDQKKVYVVSLVKNDVPKRRRKGEVLSRRSRTLLYNLRMPTGEILRVCKKMFLSTLAIGEWSISNWVNRANSNESQTSDAEEKEFVGNLLEKE